MKSTKGEPTPDPAPAPILDSATPRPRRPGPAATATAPSRLTAVLFLLLLVPACATRPTLPPFAPDTLTLSYYLDRLDHAIDAIPDTPRDDVRHVAKRGLRVDHTIAQYIIDSQPAIPHYERFLMWIDIYAMNDTIQRYHRPPSDPAPRDPLPSAATIRCHLDTLAAAIPTAHHFAIPAAPSFGFLLRTQSMARDALNEADKLDAHHVRPDHADYERHTAWQKTQKIRAFLRNYAPGAYSQFRAFLCNAPGAD